ncbi:hypothetical protein [Roseiconus lacunae]|uniref:Uncharacterized protein n=1 Tax=Roseiconus lacunae TaxID=2605694 RepID=A0ABT7PDW1_9BACT|nr:hypothetical protein [Roseiconus lacunae]MDM4014692.1 hypothetical protein [Roseiconus lacunae]
MIAPNGISGTAGNSASRGLSHDEHHAWLDWMQFFKGIDIEAAPGCWMTVSEPYHGDVYREAVVLRSEWERWRADRKRGDDQ